MEMEKTCRNLQQPRRIEFPERLLFDSSPITTAAAATSKTSFYSKSWKEKAITEDSESFLGGYIWPPRSYSCSFCTREFSSAQALGGHMNIHRRDRAKLKQEEEEEEDHQDILLYKNCVTYTEQNPNPNSYSLALRLKRGFDEEGEEKKRLNSKRRKDLICCFVNSFNLSGEELQEFESEVTNLSLRSHVGELDLELRLGRSTA